MMISKILNKYKMIEFVIGFIVALVMCFLAYTYLLERNDTKEAVPEPEVPVTENFNTPYDPERLLTQLLSK